MVDPFWGQEHQDGGLPSWWIHFGVRNIKMEAHHHGGSIFGGEEHQDGGLPSWWIHFGVRNIKMEAYHHGGSNLQ